MLLFYGLIDLQSVCLITESDSDEAENICPICSRSFPTFNGVRVHWRVHSAEEIHNAINNKTQQPQQSNPVVATEPELTELEFQCFECGVDTENEQNYIAHMRSHLPNSSTTHNADDAHLSTSNQEFVEYVSRVKQFIRIVKRIPKGARHVVANDLTRLIDKCLNTNAARDWKELLLFTYKTLRLPEKKDGVSLVQIIKQNSTTSTSTLPSFATKKSNKQSPLSSRVEAKLADFDIRGAVTLMSSTDTLAMNSRETYEELLKKHPHPSRNLKFPSEPDGSIQPLQVDSSMVQASICSFANGSSAGTDGLRPQHLKDIISLSAGEAGRRALDAVTRLTNFMLAGKLNDEICELIYGASLCALTKKDGHIRPIAIGTTFRRLTSKIACYSVKSDMINYLLPRQTGFGVKFGSEGAVHAIRTYIRNPRNASKVCLKVDVSNAFNSVERDVMLTEIKTKVPQIYHYLRQCYLKPTFLAFGDKVIASKVGAQQGDPAGPLIFSLAIHPMVTQLNTELNIWYLDDGTLADTPDKVLSNLTFLKEKAKLLGLELNYEKCELYFCNGSIDTDIVNSFKIIAPGIRIVSDDELELLGSPLHENGIENFARRKFDKIFLLINRLSSLQSHYAYFILKNCLAIPKLVYLLRCTPLWKYQNLLHEMDIQMKSALETLVNVQMNTDQWIQSSLPVNFGGLGIRSLLEISLPAYLASVNGVKDIVSTLINIQDYDSEIPFYAEALSIWSDINNGALPENPKSQFSWDQINIKRIVSELNFPNPVEQFRFQLLQNKMSGAWLNAIPSPNIGTFLNDDVIRTCIGLRLGTKICRPFECACGFAVDALGRHALHCKKNSGKFFRHANLNRIIHQSLASIHQSSLLEPTGLFRDDGQKRPDGITYTAWEKGRALVWDATCVDSLAISNMTGGTKHPGMASQKAAVRKHAKYSKIKQNYHLVAFAVETFGPWSKEAVDLINKIGSNLIRVTGEPKSKRYLIERISLAIQHGNAMSVISSIPKSSSMEEIYNL